MVCSDGGEPEGNGLIIDGPPFGLEKIYDYEPGGHHPVQLGDLLNARYKVIHKLGSGGYANVWLCRDTSSAVSRYCALKIIMAEGSTKDYPELRINKLVDLGLDRQPTSEYFCLPSDQFEIDGPNGVHYVFVYLVLGPRVSRLMSFANSEDPGIPLRKICFQATQAMAALHAHGICHGDFRPANILAHISGLDHLSEDDVLIMLGQPRTAKVVQASGDEHTLPTAPQYVVYPVDWDDVAQGATGRELIIAKACVIDFGECYDLKTPPDDLGIPQVYCAPEYALDNKVGPESDLWALGCTLFEIRTGRMLFDTFDDDVDEYLWKWSQVWDMRRQFFEDDVDANGRVVEVCTDSTDRQGAGGESHPVLFQQPEPRSLQDALSRGLVYEGKYGPEGTWRAISQEETDIFSDLLVRLLNLNPEGRLTASHALEHGWIKI
ncbi:kinase-like domain-containing protein [Xylariaceae sp. FL0662B]|nr:kinase-like domain-containing protein [Xylariaceae sp. FL0662B]